VVNVQIGYFNFLERLDSSYPEAALTFCNNSLLEHKKVKMPCYWNSILQLGCVTCHYEITQCYRPPDKSEHIPT